MAQKSILDLERYKKLLDTMLNEICLLSRNNVFNIGDIDRYDMSLAISKVENIRNSISIVEQEITMACLSNSMQYEDQVISIFQAEKIFNNMNEQISFLKDIRNIIFKEREHPERIKILHQTIPCDAIDSEIEILYKNSYSLGEKIYKAKEKSLTEIDMDALVSPLVVKVE